MRGTVDWTTKEVEFDAPPEGGIVSVCIVRKASPKFDKLVKRTMWVDYVHIGRWSTAELTPRWVPRVVPSMPALVPERRHWRAITSEGFVLLPV